MKRHFPKWIAGAVLVAFLGISLTAWNQQAGSKTLSNDTTPKPREKKIRDLDEALIDLDRHQMELDIKLKNITIPAFDGEKMKLELEKAMKDLDAAKLKMDFKIDGDKIKADIENALKDLDGMQLKMELKELSGFDGEKIKAEVREALKNIDAEKLKMEINASVSKVDLEKMKTELAKIRDVEMPKIALEMKDLQPKIRASMEKAQQSIEKAKAEIQEYKAFEEGLAKDGLIDKTNYSIQHVDGQLKINGKVQPADVYNKYRSFLEKHKDFEMQKNLDGFNINNTKKD